MAQSVDRRAFLRNAVLGGAGLVVLGNVATQFEGPLEFEPVTMRITNNAEADAALRCAYREGWSL